MRNSKKDSDLNGLLWMVTGMFSILLFVSLSYGWSPLILLILLFGGTISLIAIQRHLARLIALAFVDHIAFIVLPFGHSIKSFWLRNIVLRKSNWNAPQEEHTEEEEQEETSSEPAPHELPVSWYALLVATQAKTSQ